MPNLGLEKFFISQISTWQILWLAPNKIALFLGGESDQESNKTDGSVVTKDASMGDLKDHGVVSLHYPEEEDARSIDSLDVTNDSENVSL